MDQFLAIADRHKIGVMFVLFDARLGPVPAARQAARTRSRACTTRAGCRAPGAVILADPERHDALKAYVAGVVGRFRADRRVHAWDLFNEPDNPNRSSYGRLEPADKPELSLALLEEDLRLGARGRPVAAADRRRLDRAT